MCNLGSYEKIKRFSVPDITMNNFLIQLQTVFYSIKLNTPLTLKLLAIFWIVQIINVLVGYRLNYLGIFPRKIASLPGIFCCHFLHGNFTHIIFNSIPLFFLMNFVLAEGWHPFLCVTLLIMILSGSTIWLLGRRGLHIGASALLLGYFGYLLANTYQHFSVMSLMLAILCLYYFGGLFASMLPSKKGVSWDGHLYGFIAGLAASVLCH